MKRGGGMKRHFLFIGAAVFIPAVIAAILFVSCGGGGGGASGPQGSIKHIHVPCDSGLAIDSSDPFDAAKALGICDGLQSAEWALPDGSIVSSPSATFDPGHGILSSFGPNVQAQEGAAMLALSTGTARASGDAGYASDLDKNYSNALPSGFPATAAGCPTPGPGHDGIALKVTLTVPSWAHAYRFRSKYYTHDYPNDVCSQVVDTAIVRAVPAPAGAVNGNVLLTALGNPIDANSNSYIEVCSTCPLGASELQGTGFESNGATSWLVTTAPATPGTTLTLYFTIWDSFDGIASSTVLFDAWDWLESTESLSTVPG